MRVSSVFPSRLCALAPALIPVLCVVISCAPAPPAATIPPERLVLGGTIRVDGADPDTRTIALEDSTGRRWNLFSRDLEHELMHLDGLQARIAGAPRAGSAGSLDILVERYELLPWVGLDRFPKVGYLVREGERLILIDPNAGARFVIDGQLAGLIDHLAGQKIWILSDETGTERFDTDGTPFLRMRGYGRLSGPLPAPVSAPHPADTLRDSDSR